MSRNIRTQLRDALWDIVEPLIKTSIAIKLGIEIRDEIELTLWYHVQSQLYAQLRKQAFKGVKRV